MTVAIPLALILATPAGPASASDVRLTAIVEANKSSYEACIKSVGEKYPDEGAPKTRENPTVAEAQAAYDKAMRNLNAAVKRIEEDGKCWRAFETAIQPKLEAAGATPDRVRGVMTAWKESTDAPPVEPIRAGGAVAAPTKVKDVKPVYPAAARKAGVRGVVVVQYTVTPEGTVTDVKIMRGFPKLDAAAITAVQQWRYEPSPLRAPVTMNVPLKFPPD